MAKRINLTDRDRNIMTSLWKWKLSTTATIYMRLFQGLSWKVCYNRLQDLYHDHYIKRHYEASNGKMYWTLDKKGFQAFLPTMNELKEIGYKSEFPAHDILVNAFQIGDQFISNRTIYVYTEQMLRRFHPEQYSSWVPHIENHRSDGYWGIPIGDKMVTVALEVEVNVKQLFKYNQVGINYQFENKVYRVLWLVITESCALRISHSLHLGKPEDNKKHNFV